MYLSGSTGRTPEASRSTSRSEIEVLPALRRHPPVDSPMVQELQVHAGQCRDTAVRRRKLGDLQFARARVIAGDARAPTFHEREEAGHFQAVVELQFTRPRYIAGTSHPPPLHKPQEPAHSTRLPHGNNLVNGSNHENNSSLTSGNTLASTTAAGRATYMNSCPRKRKLRLRLPGPEPLRRLSTSSRSMATMAVRPTMATRSMENQAKTVTKRAGWRG